MEMTIKDICEFQEWKLKELVSALSKTHVAEYVDEQIGWERKKGTVESKYK